MMQNKIQVPPLQIHNQNLPDLLRFKARNVPIDICGVFASLGFCGVNFENELVGEIPFRASWLRKIGVQPDKVMILHVTGDSTEPTIWDGLIELMDQAQTEPKGGHIYAFVEGNHLWIKLLRIMDEETLYESELEYKECCAGKYCQVCLDQKILTIPVAPYGKFEACDLLGIGVKRLIHVKKNLRRSSVLSHFSNKEATRYRC